MASRCLTVWLTIVVLTTFADRAAAVDATFVLDEQQSSLTIGASTRIGVLTLDDNDTQQLSGTLDTTLNFGAAGGFPQTADFTVNGADILSLGPLSLTLGRPPLLGVQVLFDGAVADVTTTNPPAALTQLPTGLVRYQFDAAEYDVSLVEGIIQASGVVNQTVDLAVTPVTGTADPGTFGTLTFVNLTPMGSLTEIDTLLLLPIDFTEVVDFDGQEVTLDVTGNIVASGSFLVNLNGLAADIDNDGDVDSQDFLLIQQNDPALINDWLAEYGGSGTSMAIASTAVPEPVAISLIGALLLTLSTLRGSR